MAPGCCWKRKWMNRSREGQALSEYALVLLFIAIACVVALTLLGAPIQGIFLGLSGSF
jgi:Flp pilus assembly pilin Flp